MTRLVLFNKPYGVLPQFTDGEGRATLADHVPIKGIYPAGRLDKDSEGLMLLTDNGRLQARISNPKFRTEKEYWAQVEGTPSDAALIALAEGVTLKDGPTRPAKAARMDPPESLWPRDPPIRYRKNVADTWLSLTITEGRNRQVRRMTAAVGHPTLRLIRVRIGSWGLEGLEPGAYRFETP